MLNVFLGIILACISVVVLAITAYILITIIDTTIKQLKKK